MKLPIITTLVIAIGFLTITIAEAKIYTWTDAAGEKHYSATPPKPNEKTSNLTDDLRITDNKSVSFKGKKIAPTTVEKSTVRINGSNNKVTVKTSKKRNFCRNQQKNLRLLKNNTYFKKGKKTSLNNKQRKNKIRKLKNSLHMDCSLEVNKRARKSKIRNTKYKKKNH